MMKKKVLALTLAAFVACGAAGCGGEEKKPAPKPENKQTTNVKKDEKQKAPEKKVDPAVKHAQEVMRLPAPVTVTKTIRARARKAKAPCLPTAK